MTWFTKPFWFWAMNLNRITWEKNPTRMAYINLHFLFPVSISNRNQNIFLDSSKSTEVFENKNKSNAEISLLSSSHISQFLNTFQYTIFHQSTYTIITCYCMLTVVWAIILRKNWWFKINTSKKFRIHFFRSKTIWVIYQFFYRKLWKNILTNYSLIQQLDL